MFAIRLLAQTRKVMMSEDVYQLYYKFQDERDALKAERNRYKQLLIEAKEYLNDGYIDELTLIQRINKALGIIYDHPHPWGYRGRKGQLMWYNWAYYE